ncbi:MAG: sigma 54-interacting transcriptional regulator, partial [Desulfofustis sp.]|nr:sigma 54-interacting transcriptional regulator [Desulfofustis sp.]
QNDHNRQAKSEVRPVAAERIRDRYTILCEHWLSVLDELSIGAFTVATGRQISSMNYTAQALMGLKEDEVLGRDCREVFTGVPCMVQCLLRNGDAETTDEPEVEIINEDEHKHLLTRMATPIYDDSGSVVGCMTVLQDHTPIADLVNRIHYEERSLKLILDNLDVGVFTVNRGGYITFFNHDAEKVSGFDRRQVIGKHCSAIFEGSAAHDLCLLKESIANGTARVSRRGRITTKNGETIPIRATYMALRNEKGTIIGGLATFQDLTLVRQLNQAISERYTFQDMIGKDPGMQKIFETVNVVAATDATVLIEGATGTGKDLLAKVIHSVSRRSDKQLVKVNCAAIPDNLLESEMFGYIKGAFTGADRDKPGRFNEADGGTIFLDEIGDLPLSLQAKLLRVLEDKEFYPLGSRHTQKVDVRIISATNRDLGSLVERRQFREDLYYRLNVFRIQLPDLKARRIDLPLLIHHILRKLCAARDNRRMEISEAAMKILLNYDYPGNVRELENILEHALIICHDDVIQPRHLPEFLQHPGPPLRKEAPHAAVEAQTDAVDQRDRLRRVLEKHDWHRQHAARELGVDRTTLWRWMKKYDLSP